MNIALVNLIYKYIFTELSQPLQKWIAASKPIGRRNMDMKDLLGEANITLVPGEVYPDTVHVITSRLDLQEEGSKEEQLLSVEPCCGTHLHNSGHIGNFAITSIVSSYSFERITVIFAYLI